MKILKDFGILFLSLCAIILLLLILQGCNEKEQPAVSVKQVCINGALYDHYNYGNFLIHRNGQYVKCNDTK